MVCKSSTFWKPTKGILHNNLAPADKAELIDPKIEKPLFSDIVKRGPSLHCATSVKVDQKTCFSLEAES
jgi:hypothetical protein